MGRGGGTVAGWPGLVLALLLLGWSRRTLSVVGMNLVTSACMFLSKGWAEMMASVVGFDDDKDGGGLPLTGAAVMTACDWMWGLLRLGGIRGLGGGPPTMLNPEGPPRGREGGNLEGGGGIPGGGPGGIREKIMGGGPRGVGGGAWIMFMEGTIPDGGGKPEGGGG